MVTPRPWYQSCFLITVSDPLLVIFKIGPSAWKAEGRRFDPWLSGWVVWDAVTDELVAGGSHAWTAGRHAEAVRQSHTALRQAVSSAAPHSLSS